MSAVTGAAIRNSIFHVLKGCTGKQATFSNGKRNASHISRSVFSADLLKKIDKGYNCCFAIVRLETKKCSMKLFHFILSKHKKQFKGRDILFVTRVNMFRPSMNTAYIKYNSNHNIFSTDSVENRIGGRDASNVANS